jgi:hypothetical protein
MMKSLAVVRQQLARGDFDFTLHAFRRAVERDVSAEEISEAGREAVVIEDYPDDKYSPSSLLLGFTRSGCPLHLQVSRDEGDTTRVITLYEPAATEWEEYRRRK